MLALDAGKPGGPLVDGARLVDPSCADSMDCSFARASPNSCRSVADLAINCTATKAAAQVVVVLSSS